LVKNVVGNPGVKDETPGLEPSPRSGGLGEGVVGSPTTGGAPTVYTYTAYWRRTEMGAVTEEIVVCLVCRRVLEPSRVRRSRRGTHGEDYYVHEHPLLSIVLEQSNSGRRRVVVPKEFEEIRDLIERAWIYEGASVEDVRKAITQYLRIR
jgi:hypothetical protein